MSRWLFLVGILVLGVVALVLSEMNRTAVPVGPRALLNFVADTSRELARVPTRLMPLSDEEEIRIGNEMAQEQGYRLETGQSDEHSQAAQAYVEKVGRWVAGHARRKLPYQFHFIAAPSFINAFALPGGHVYLGAGLMALMDSEDELANILGHEVEHIDLRHCAERIQLEGRTRNLPLGGLVRLPIELFEAGYSKNQELEADREGAALAVKSGYSPMGAISVFQALDRLHHEQVSQPRTPQEELSQVARDTLEGYFRSHPPPAERIAQIQALISNEHWETLTYQRPLPVKVEGARVVD